MKRLGLQLDRGKIGTCSMFFVAEFMCTLFYFTFYRLLFEQFIGWGLFFGIQAIHFAMEWCMYCVRGTRSFYNFTKNLPDCLSVVRNAFVMPGLSFRDWQMFLSLDFSIRVSILIFSAPVRTSFLLHTV